MKQFAQRAGCLGAYAGFNPVPDADEGDDRGGFHEIKMTALPCEQCPRAIRKRGRRTERYQRVHIRTAHFELIPCATIKLSASDKLHRARERERKPSKPN